MSICPRSCPDSFCLSFRTSRETDECHLICPVCNNIFNAADPNVKECSNCGWKLSPCTNLEDKAAGVQPLA